MIEVAAALVPSFAVIAFGWAGRRWGFPGDAFWDGAEKIAYFVLFPALMIKNISVAPLDRIEPGPFASAILISMAINFALAYGAGRTLKLDGPQMGAFLQSGVRFNTYVGFGAAASLGGSEGFAFFSVAIALVIPVANILSVWGLAYFAGRAAPSLGGILVQIAKNPFFVSVVFGIVLNLAKVEIPAFGARPIVDMLAAAALFLGLASVGAGLDVSAIKETGPAVAAGIGLKLVVLPCIVWLICRLVGLDGIAAWAVMIYATLPLAPAAYVLTRQMGGDAGLMAGLITASTLIAALTMPIMLALLG